MRVSIMLVSNIEHIFNLGATQANIHYSAEKLVVNSSIIYDKNLGPKYYTNVLFGEPNHNK